MRRISGLLLAVPSLAVPLLAGLWLLGSAGTAAWGQTDAQYVRYWKQEWPVTDFTRSSVDFSEILHGGPPKDGIPPIDEPAFVSVAEANGMLADREPVIGLVVNGEAKAYPLQVLMFHEIANDTIGGIPVSVTFCPLCNAAIVFDRRVGDRVLDFGTTGKLRRSDLVMWDRQTESWWQQFTGEAIAGARIGTRLKVVPSRLESWQSFRERFPDGEVLVPGNPGLRDYGRNPYAGYDSSAVPFLYRGPMPDGISPLSYVVVVRDGPEPLAISLDRLRREQTFESDGVKIEWLPGVRSVLDTSAIEEGREIGSVNVTRKGEPVAHELTFAFVVRAFLPETAILK